MLPHGRPKCRQHPPIRQQVREPSRWGGGRGRGKPLPRLVVWGLELVWRGWWIPNCIYSRRSKASADFQLRSSTESPETDQIRRGLGPPACRGPTVPPTPPTNQLQSPNNQPGEGFTPPLTPPREPGTLLITLHQALPSRFKECCKNTMRSTKNRSRGVE